ncbi:MAG TPA: 2-amino-4-ketopentanoate thiolase [Sediminispirochaeta sp.]|nr:2-amino-4-ketopentanoate thiolase [Sediminispirochaeta sp.]
MSEERTTPKARKGDWVRIQRTVLEPGERAEHIPEDTRKVPLEMWAKGFLLDEEARVGEVVEIETGIGRRMKGIMESINPGYRHSFGETVPELLKIGRQLRAWRWEHESGRGGDG